MIFQEMRVPRFGFTATDPKYDIPPDALITGSKNMMFTGQGELESIGGWKLTGYGGLSSNRGGDISMLVGKGWAIIGNELGEGSGNVAEFIGRSLWFTGTGDITVYMPGITATPQAIGNSALQNNIPQIAPLNGTKTGYDSPVQVGMLPELTAPMLRANSTPGAAFQGVMLGTYSAQISHIRESTGAESLSSPTSNVITLSNQSLIVQFTNTPTNAVGHGDKWRFYGTKSNFGGTGPFFFYIDIPIRRVTTETNGASFPTPTGYAVEDSGGSTFNVFRRNPSVAEYFTDEQIGMRLLLYDNTNAVIHTATITALTGSTVTHHGVVHSDKVLFTPVYSGTTSNTDRRWKIDAATTGLNEYEYELEYLDTDLVAIQPPTDFFPPATTASFIVPLVNVMCLIGTEDGNGVAVSVPNFPESYPPDFRFSLPEPPVAVLARPQDGYFNVLCANSVHEIRWTGAVDGPPVTLRSTDQIGTLQQTSCCQVGNDLYMFTPSHKAARLLASGVVDTTFGDKMEEEFKTWTAGRVNITFDEKRSYIMYAYIDRMALYYPDYDAWTPIIYYADTESAGKPDGSLQSLFTMNGIVHQSFYTSETVSTVSITSLTQVVNSSISFFTHRHLGKTIDIPGAGSGGSTLTGAVITNINSATQVNISLAAVTTSNGVIGTVKGFDMWTFDRDTSDIPLNFSTSWICRYSFSDYGVGLRPKTVTMCKVGAKTTVSTTYNLRFFRDYNTSSQIGNTRTFNPGAGNHISDVVDCNNGEAQKLSVQLDGTGIRNKVHFIWVMGDASGINTNYNV